MIEILVASSPRHARLCAEMYVDGRFAGLISEEQPPVLEIELPPVAAEGELRFMLDQFLQAISDAKSRLRKLDIPQRDEKDSV